MISKNPIVYDIDGTLTAEPYVEDNVRNLRANSVMVLTALALQLERPLLISTARPDYLREETEAWLNSCGLEPKKVYMKEMWMEELPDFQVKEIHLDQIRVEWGTPVVWVDDNPQNVNMLRNRNVPVIHVTPR